MARNKAFTLVEFLTGTAVVALLGAVMIPITAQARQKVARVTTASNLRAVGLAAVEYATDYDGSYVLTQQGDAGASSPWSVLMQPYLPGHSAYFDPTRTVVETPTAFVGSIELPWYTLTSISLNDSGYSGKWATIGGSCTGRRISYNYGQRSTSTIANPSQRIAFSPTTYASTGLGWSFFHGYDASWIRPNVLGSTFSWNNMVYNTKAGYAGGLIPAVTADGGALKLNPAADFTSSDAAPALADYCSWNTSGGSAKWGSFWTND